MITFENPNMKEFIIQAEKKRQAEGNPRYMIYLTTLHSSNGNLYDFLFSGNFYKRDLKNMRKEDADNGMLKYENQKLSLKEFKIFWRQEYEDVLDYVIVDFLKKEIIFYLNN